MQKKPTVYTHFDVEAIISTLSTPVEKHILWSGHGNRNSRTLGLPLDDVIGVINQIPNVTCFNLSSCFILAHARNIISKVQSSTRFIFNNGPVSVNRTIDGISCLAAYFAIDALPKECLSKPTLATHTLWISGPTLENQPYCVQIPSSGHMAPLPLPFVSNSIGFIDLTRPCLVYGGIERLFISPLWVTPPVHLKGEITLLSGLGEPNAFHLFDKIETDLSFEGFVTKSLSSALVDQYPAVRKQEKRLFPVFHEGNLLFLIQSLKCSDGLFEKIIHYQTPSQEKKIFLFKEGYWVNWKPGSGMQVSSAPEVEKSLSKAWANSVPNHKLFSLQGLPKKNLELAIQTGFNLNPVFRECQTFSTDESQYLPPRLELSPLLWRDLSEELDILKQINDGVSPDRLRSNYLARDEYGRQKVLLSLIQIDAEAQFEMFLEQERNIPPIFFKTLIAMTIRMNRLGMLRCLFDKQAVKASEHLNLAATYDHLRIFQYLLDKNVSRERLKKLLETAKEHYCWNVSSYIEEILPSWLLTV